VLLWSVMGLDMYKERDGNILLHGCLSMISALYHLQAVVYFALIL